jgi:hypothetical protein
MSLLAGESAGQTKRLMSAASIIDEMMNGAEDGELWSNLNDNSRRSNLERYVGSPRRPRAQRSPNRRLKCPEVPQPGNVRFTVDPRRPAVPDQCPQWRSVSPEPTRQLGGNSRRNPER